MFEAVRLLQVSFVTNPLIGQEIVKQPIKNTVSYVILSSSVLRLLLLLPPPLVGNAVLIEFRRLVWPYSAERDDNALSTLDI